MLNEENNLRTRTKKCNNRAVNMKIKLLFQKTKYLFLRKQRAHKAGDFR